MFAHIAQRRSGIRVVARGVRVCARVDTTHKSAPREFQPAFGPSIRCARAACRDADCAAPSRRFSQ
eukprot:7159125-Lingulodinium_polyedra.AAC.1